MKISCYLFAACCVIGVGGMVFVHTHKVAIAKQLDSWYLLPRPENLTELYFTDHHTLPKVLAAGTRYALKFTVHNLEHQTTTYRYALTATPEKDSTALKLGDGTVTVESGHSQVVHQVITVPAAPVERVNIKVDLEYQGVAFGDNAPSTQTQAIHYWMRIADSPAASKGSHERV